MKKSTLLAVIAIVLLLGISFVLCIVCYQETKIVSNYFDGDEISALYSVVNDQYEINRRLDEVSKDSRYTFDKPYIELNPYKISPLSAIIIYSDKIKSEVSVYINDELYTTMESSNSHIIPIYGLYEDYENIIKLISNDRESILTIKTEKSNIEYPLEIIKKSDTLDNSNIYFTVASYATWLTGWDIDGKLRFYLTEDFRMDVEWLDNGHFLIGTPQGQNREQFVGFYEMDYLGKIYNYYIPEHGYSFESQILRNGNYMLAGGNVPIYMTDQYVHEINPQTGSTVSSINLSEIIRKIDSEFPEKYLGAAVIRNGFYLEENTRELVVSFREINTILSFNYDEKSLNWIFTNPDNEVFKNECWDEYKVISDNNRYPLGQHTPAITKEGYLAFFNNGYDRYAMAEGMASDDVADYKDQYTSMEIYDIKDNKATLIWNYDYNKELLSIKYGLFRVREDNHKFINLGYILKDEYRNKKGSSISGTEKGIDDIYTLIMELDEKDNIIFEAKCEEGKFRSFKHTLYNETTSNINLKELNIYNELSDDKLIATSSNELRLDEAIEWINTLKFTQNTLETDYPITSEDEIKLHFVSSNGKIQTLIYKEKSSKNNNRVFNVNLVGRYALFIEINGVIYNPKKIIQF